MQIESELGADFCTKRFWVFISTRVPSQTISMPAMINPNQKGKENYDYLLLDSRHQWDASSFTYKNKRITRFHLINIILLTI